MVRVELPVLARVTVCGAETLPAMVLAKVREFCDAAKAAMGAVFEGDMTMAGVELPVRSMKSGLEAASLSMMRVPVSVVDGGAPELGETWLMGV